MLLSPSSRVQGRLARRAGAVLVARLSFHSKPTLKKFSASHAQGQSRATVLFAGAQRRCFGLASKVHNYHKNLAEGMIKSNGRNFTGRLYGGIFGLGVGFLVFLPTIGRSIADNWEANQPSDGPYNRADSIVMRPYFTDSREHRRGVIASIGVVAFGFLWPLPYVSAALFGLMGFMAVNAVIADEVRQNIARTPRVGAAPVVNVQEIAEAGDVSNVTAAGFSELPAIPEGTEFDTLRLVLTGAVMRRLVLTEGLSQKIEDMKKLIATGKATSEDLEAVLKEDPRLTAAVTLAQPFGDYQSVHRKLTELICHIEAGKTEDDLQDEYIDLAHTLDAVYTDPIAATQRRNSTLQAREKATPNIYVRPTYLRPVAFV